MTVAKKIFCVVPMILVEVTLRATALMAGQNFSFNCTVKGANLANSTISYEWLKGDMPVGSNSRLTFDMLRLSDAGKYSCHVTVNSSVLSSPLNSSSEQVNLILQSENAKCTLHLHVIIWFVFAVPSPVVVISSSTTPSPVNDGTFTLTCITTLSSPLLIFDRPVMVLTTWTGPGEFTLQGTSGNISVEDSSHESQLIVRNAGDKGAYSCNVTLSDESGSSFIVPSVLVTESGKSISTVFQTPQSIAWLGNCIHVHAVISCGSPPNIANGSSTTITNTIQNGTVTYNCSNGYQQMGSATVTCQANRSWSMTPTCEGIKNIYLLFVYTYHNFAMC